jgi:hypothetical protein
MQDIPHHVICNPNNSLARAIDKAFPESLPVDVYALQSSKLIDEGRKVRSIFPIAAALVILGCATTSAHNAVPPNIASTVANQDRPDEDRQRDADRKPAEVLTFVGVKNGEKVADFIPGTGYFSRYCRARLDRRVMSTASFRRNSQISSSDRYLRTDRRRIHNLRTFPSSPRQSTTSRRQSLWTWSGFR